MAQFETMWELCEYTAGQMTDPATRERIFGDIGEDIHRKATFVVAVQTGLMPKEERPDDWTTAAFAIASEILPDGAWHWVDNWHKQAVEEGMVAA